MADGPIEPDTAGDYPSNMEARVAVLEQMACATLTTLDRIERRLEAFETNTRNDLRQIQTDMRQLETSLRTGMRELEISVRIGMKELETGLRAEMRQLRGNARADFRLVRGIALGGFAGLLSLMAHKLHWL
jgi:hypothetical protein